MTSIVEHAFSGCANLTSIVIPESITEIGYFAFSGCTGLSNVYITDLKAYLNIDYDSHEFYTPTKYAKNLYVNNELLTEVVIPDGVETIPLYAFSNNTNITSVTIPDSVTSIGEGAFWKCSKLETVTIPDSVISIGNYAFDNCSGLTNVYVNDLKAYLNIDFKNNYSMPTYYGHDLYLNDELLTEVVILDGVETIPQYVFCNNTNITSVAIPNSVTNIGESAFSGCSGLTNVYISDLKAYLNIDFKDYSSVPTNYGHNLYLNNELLTEVVIPDGVETIPLCVFDGNKNITSVTIPDSVTSIGSSAFYCSNLTNVYYNGTEDEWNAISIDYGNSNLTKANRIYFAYVTFFDENGKELSENKYPLNTYISISDFEEKPGHTLNIFTNEECTQKFDLQTPITENATLYLKYVINKYTYKFLDEDNKTVLKEETVDYGTVITPPENPRKQGTQKNSYSFTKWNGYTDGMKLEDDTTFTAQYQESINKYTYKFLDEDNKTVLKEETVDYGTVIIPPEISDKTEYYLFDYWKGYTTGAELTDDIEFTAVYKYKNYKVTATGLTTPVTVTYNSNYTVEPQTKDGYNFIGYLTEADGKGRQITNEKGESLKAYDVVGDLTVYPYFYSGYMNKVELQGVATAMPGDTIKQNAIFATDKEAMYVTATIKYPEYLNFQSISGGDFAEASKDSETLKDGYKYLDITCLYDYNGGNMPINQNLIPFEITFEVATDAPIENANISIENVTLIGNDEYSITDFTNNIVEITPKLAESVSITGNNNIDKITKYTATVSPDYTTNKAVTWSVDNEEIATISQDGKLTPIKNGTVKVTATAQDGSGKFDTKTVNVTAYATITSLECNGIAVEIVPDKYDYTVYVKNDATKISLTPTHSGGTLRLNGSGIWRSGQTKEIDLTDKETTVTLNRNNVPGMTDNAYTIKIVKFEGTKTTVSDNGTKFTVTPINIASGNTVILALYNGDTFVEMQSATYNGEDIPFTTSESYTKAKVMVWSNLTDIMPICDVEIIE